MRLVIADDGARHRHRAVVEQAVRVGLVDAGERRGAGPGGGPAPALRARASRPASERLGDLRPRRRARRGGDRGRPGGRRGLPRHRAAAAAPRSRVEVPVARRGEPVMLLRVGQLAARRCRPRSVRRGHPPRPRPGGRARRPHASPALSGERLVPFVPLARLYGQPARGAPAPARGHGLRPAAGAGGRRRRGRAGGAGAADHRARGRHRPAARGRGAPRLGRAGGGALARRPRPARVPARPARCRASGRGRAARAGAAGRRLAGHARDGAPPAGGRRLRGVGGGRRRGGAVAARRGAASTAWSPTSRCRAWTASS